MIFYDPKKRTLPQQVQKNKEDIKEIKDNLTTYFSTSLTLTEQTTSILASQTNVPADFEIGNNTFLIDQNALAFKIVADYLDENNARTFTLLFYANFKGAQGEGFNFMNTWVSGNEYHKNDVVTYAGSDGITRTYVLKSEQLIGSTTPPDEDTTNWGLMLGGSNSGLSYTDCSSWVEVMELFMNTDFQNTKKEVKGVIFYGNGTNVSWATALKNTFRCYRFNFQTLTTEAYNYNPFSEISNPSVENSIYLNVKTISEGGMIRCLEASTFTQGNMQLKIIIDPMSEGSMWYNGISQGDVAGEAYSYDANFTFGGKYNVGFPTGCKLRIYYE